MELYKRLTENSFERVYDKAHADYYRDPMTHLLTEITEEPLVMPTMNFGNLEDDQKVNEEDENDQKVNEEDENVLSLPKMEF